MPAYSALAAEIAIFISSEIPAYSKATLGIQQSLPPQTIIHEYRMKGDMAQGHEMAKSIRALNPELVFAVGLKIETVKISVSILFLG